MTTNTVKPESGPAMDDSTTTSDGTQLSLTTRDMRRVLASSFMGNMIEFYDFILYATCASIVFEHVFFANLGAGFALFASFATFAVGYLARPLGGILFGHFGDTRGRKNVFILSIVLMGAASTLIGLLPPTAAIGMAAPIALALLRVLQGIAVGGDWGGAMLVALEHAPQRSRGMASSIVNAGGPVGAVIATLVLAVFTLLPHDSFMTWGWRIPFLLSSVLLVLGLVVRLQVAETPMFTKLQQLSVKKRVPIVDVLKHNWRQVIVAMIAVLAFTTTQGLMTVWGVSEAVGHGANPTGVLNWKAFGAIVTVIVALIAGRLSDRLGRRAVIAFGCGLGVVLAFPIMWMLGTGTVLGFGAAILLGNGLVQGIVYGPIAAFVTEQFPTARRFTGSSTAYQTASTIGAGFSPMVATGLVLAVGSTWPVAVLWIVVLIVAAGAVFITPEGRDVDIRTVR